MSAVHLRRWDDIERYLPTMDPNDSESSLLSAMLMIHRNQFSAAVGFIDKEFDQQIDASLASWSHSSSAFSTSNANAHSPHPLQQVSATSLLQLNRHSHLFLLYTQHHNPPISSLSSSCSNATIH